MNKKHRYVLEIVVTDDSENVRERLFHALDHSGVVVNTLWLEDWSDEWALECDAESEARRAEREVENEKKRLARATRAAERKSVKS